MNKDLQLAGALTLMLGCVGNALGHHSYSMFDDRGGTRSASGTVAKLDWSNPHVFIWILVPSQATPGKTELWAFENGSPSVLVKFGWNKSSLQAGEKVTVEYWPLRDGGNGGHCASVKLADRRVLQCVGNLGNRR
jgi:hypothetical protein